jgi:DNA primase
MFWRRHGTNGLGGLKTRDLPLYGTHEIAGADAGSVVVVVEGEKARDALAARSVLAVATVTGANGVPADAVLRELLDYDVILWPDADEPGREHMRKLGRRLRAIGRTPRWFEWREAPDAGDAADWAGSDDELRAALAGAETVSDETVEAAPTPDVRGCRRSL